MNIVVTDDISYTIDTQHNTNTHTRELLPRLTMYKHKQSYITANIQHI